MAIPIFQFIPPYISYFYYSFQKYLSGAYFKTGTMGDLNIHWNEWHADAEAPILRPREAKRWTMTHWKRPGCWETLKAKEEEGGGRWDG